jgi:hypothetical protein
LVANGATFFFFKPGVNAEVVVGMGTLKGLDTVTCGIGFTTDCATEKVKKSKLPLTSFGI